MRQKVRKFILLISLLVFPLTFYYFSPYVILLGASKGIITGSFLVFGTQIILGIVLGRGFCAYVCPAGAIQEAVGYINEKPAKTGWRNYIKYGIWLVWFSILILLFIKYGSIKKVDPFFLTDHGISVSEIGGYIIYYMVILLIILPTMLCGRRAFCHYFCWMAPFMVIGMKIRKLLHIGGLHLTTDKEKCISCKKCTKGCPMSLNVEEQVKNGKIVDTECILCGKCVDACPKNVIHYSFRR